MTGRHGMQEQLSGLRDNDDRINWATKYLVLHMIGKDWEATCKTALARYLRDPHDVSLFGALVRPLDPDQRDLSARCKALANGCHAPITVRLIALYIPADGLDILAGSEVAVETAA